jgi:hypothetical protein
MNSGYKALAASVLESAAKDIIKGKDEQRKAQAVFFSGAESENSGVMWPAWI